MNYRKKLQELTIKDNFMFGAVMMKEKNCRTPMLFLSAISILLEKGSIVTLFKICAWKRARFYSMKAPIRYS